MFNVVPFISSTGLAIVAEANLGCDFLSEKNCRQCTGSISFFSVSTTRHSLNLHKFENQSCLLEIIKHCVLVNSTCECLVFDFFFLWNHVFLCADH